MPFPLQRVEDAGYGLFGNKVLFGKLGRLHALRPPQHRIKHQKMEVRQPAPSEPLGIKPVLPLGVFVMTVQGRIEIVHARLLHHLYEEGLS